MKNLRFLLLVVFAGAVRGREIHLDNNVEASNSVPSDTTFIPSYKCSLSGSLIETVTCAASRALRVVLEVNKRSTIQIVPGISLSSNDPSNQKEVMNLKQLELPSNSKAKALALVDYLLEETARMISSRTLQIRLPEPASQSVSRALSEGRGKMKKYMLPLMLGIMAKVGLAFPVLAGGVALLASKALVISKIALALGVALLIPTLLSGAVNFGGKLQSLLPLANLGGVGGGYGANGWYGGSGGYTPYGYGTGQWTTNNLGGNAAYPYARTFSEEETDTETYPNNASAQDLAYSQQNK